MAPESLHFGMTKEAESGLVIAHMTTLLYPLNGTADGGIMDTQMACNFPQCQKLGDILYCSCQEKK
jgi:hypothetical protein